jgi:hypothetical protein
MKPEIKQAIVDILQENEHIKTVYPSGIDIDKVQHRCFPIAIIGEPDEERAKRFLFNETEISLPITIGFIADDEDKAIDLSAALKESVKATCKCDLVLETNSADQCYEPDCHYQETIPASLYHAHKALDILWSEGQEKAIDYLYDNLPDNVT